jgi:hypothetical protein
LVAIQAETLMQFGSENRMKCDTKRSKQRSMHVTRNADVSYMFVIVIYGEPTRES